MVEMSISSASGAYVFPANDMPLFARRVAYARQSEQGTAFRRIHINLDGFFTGDSHDEISAKYQELITVLRAGNVTFRYFDGAQTVLDSVSCYVDDYAEPADWKQYDGKYNISMYFFEDTHTADMADTLGIACSYSSAAGAVSFAKVPHISFQVGHARSDPYGPDSLPSGAGYAKEGQITLSGVLFAYQGGGEAELNYYRETLETALSRDGTLNYGSFSSAVNVLGYDIPAVYPKDFMPFTVQFTYSAPGIRKFECSISPSRLHYHPRIRNRWYCDGLPQVTLFGVGGQFVDYSFSLQAETIEAAQSYMATEASMIVVPGGIETDGGRQTYNITSRKVDMNFTMFYRSPVFPNLV